MERLPEGFGAVYQRRDGRWEGQIRIRGGPRRSYGCTRREAIHKLRQARWALANGLPVSAGTQSLRDFFAYWLMANRERLRPATVGTYALDVRRLEPYLGSVPLRNITPGMIQSTYTGMLRNGLSRRSVEQVHTVLHRVLSHAMHWGLTSRNPAQLATPPRPDRREMTVLSRCELQRLLQTTGRHPLAYAVGAHRHDGSA